MNRSTVKPWTINTHFFKVLLFRRLRWTSTHEVGKTDVPGYMHFAPPTKTGGDGEFFDQYGAETMKLVRVGRRMVRVFEEHRVRNEAIDLEIYALAGLYSMGDVVVKNLGALAAALTPIEEKDGDEEEEEEQRPTAGRRRRSGAWANRWK